MAPKNTKNKNTRKPQKKGRKTSRLRKCLLLSLLLPIIYLVGSGPALWSRTLISNDTYRKGVIYYVAPLMWANYQMRDQSLVERMGIPDFTAARNTIWYNWLESYWGLFGDRTLNEADRITLILKFKFAGVADVQTTSERL
jgi:hypothetical protein